MRQHTVTDVSSHHLAASVTPLDGVRAAASLGVELSPGARRTGQRMPTARLSCANTGTDYHFGHRWSTFHGLTTAWPACFATLSSNCFL
jgi:hypothetical protein